MRGTAAVIGGSIGGLYAAALLRGAGWRVDVYERSAVELAGRGAGINTHAELHRALERVGARLDELGVEVATRTGYDEAGEVLRRIDAPQLFTSWDRLHDIVRALVPDDAHHLDHRLTGVEEGADGVRATFANGRSVDVDLLIGADGFRSAVRAHLSPGTGFERYAGYVCWRGVADEADLPPALAAELFATYAFHLPADGSIALGYPIAGAGNTLVPGRRRYNWVWYRPADADELADLLTDGDGRAHAVTIPPPRIRRDVVDRLRGAGERLLCPQFGRVLAHVRAPFFTPIHDHLSPVMGRGRVALVGDAACVARPHVGLGVTKAASDACALVDALGAHGTLDAALVGYGAERVRAATLSYERGRYLGEYLAPCERDAGFRAEWGEARTLAALMRDTGTTNFC